MDTCFLIATDDKLLIVDIKVVQIVSSYEN